MTLNRSTGVLAAWVAPFVGDHHKLLEQDIQNMHKVKEKQAHTASYHINYVSMIQSLGSGKSRMVDEVAKGLFTILSTFATPLRTQVG
jgi:hypothetical protein